MKILYFLLFMLFFTTLSAKEKSVDNVTFTIQQIPEQIAYGFYAGRGFTEKQIKPYASKCLFTTTMKNNNTKESIHYLRKNWVAKTGGKTYPIKTNDYWFTKFNKTGVKPSSKIAFQYAQMPEEQRYEANGDWNQGMLSIDLPLDSRFDIIINWDIKGKKHALTIKNIKCNK
jgi:hypothetical protein